MSKVQDAIDKRESAREPKPKPKATRKPKTEQA